MRAKIGIAAEAAALGDLPRVELAALWERIYKCPPPPCFRQELLIRAAAWHVQAKRLGGYSVETRRTLKTAMGRVEKRLIERSNQASIDGDEVEDGGVLTNCNPARPRRQLLPGARLLRDWNGRTHVVDVLETGFAFEAKVYSSLSAIARKITGAHWSGPRFFGL
ncbi:DUF2924 domain-containing protein [Mesorhizobium sp. A556]